MRISEMKINNKLIDEAKLNGQIVYRLDRDRTPPEVLYVKIQLYYPLVYPSKDLYPSKNLYPKAARDLHVVYTGDTIEVEFQVNEKLKENPIVKMNEFEFETNLIDNNNNIYKAYITLTEDINPNNYIYIIISNLIDMSNNKASDYGTYGDQEDKVLFDDHLMIEYTDINDIYHNVSYYQEESLREFIKNANMKTCKITSTGLRIKDCSNLFSNCKELTSIDLSEFDTSETTNMSGMFSGCSNLEKINLSGIDTSKVTNMWDMFNSCYRLTTLDLSSFNTENVTSMDSMFFMCSGLVELNISNFNTSNNTALGQTFYGCSKLTDLDLSNFDTSKVVYMGELFYSCRALKTLDLSSFDFSGLSSENAAKNMFGVKPYSTFGVPSNCLIYVKDETAKEFVLNVRSDLTNVQIKNN